MKDRVRENECTVESKSSDVPFKLPSGQSVFSENKPEQEGFHLKENFKYSNSSIRPNAVKSLIAPLAKLTRTKLVSQLNMKQHCFRIMPSPYYVCSADWKQPLKTRRKDMTRIDIG